ncbi:MAG: geranylgeranyl reductase family protein [Deltaproteobacteria bacterium]|nr:geranylgeranyl reductase family protein [Deltaproteobacteria bacterium]
MKETYDAIIVGAGPAGCSAATFIAGLGYDVLLVDRAKFPRDKVCGDGISATSIAVLDRMGVLKRIEDTNPQIYDGVTVSAPNSCIMMGKNPPVDGLTDYGYVIPRKEFDNTLLDFVREIPNVEVRERFHVKDLVREGGKICGITGEEEKYRGRIIIGADGAHSVVARKLSLLNTDPRHKAFAMRAYFENVEGLTNSIEIHYEKSILPGYAWIFPTGKTTANVGIGVGTRFMEAKGIKNLFNIFLERNCFAREKLGNANMIENTLKGWPIPFGSLPSKRSRGNVLLIGDAASFVDTLTGEGIYYALRSGEYAARAVSEVLKNPGKEERAGGIYEKLWKKEFKWKEFFQGYMLQPVMGNKHIVNFAIKNAGRKQKNADVLAGVIAHKLPKSKLLYNF